MSAVGHTAHPAPISWDCGSRTPLPARQLIIGVALVLAVTTAVRLYQPTGWLGSDDAAYYSAAEHILTGTPITRAHHHYARLAVILPVALSVALFGHHTWAVALPTFLASVTCVMLVIALGRRLFGWREGLLAGLIVAVLPYFRVLSTTAYPDTHVCLWATASVLLCVRGLRVNGPDPTSTLMKTADRSSTRSSRWLLLASGFTLGLAISSKVFAATTVLALCILILQSNGGQWRRVISSTTFVFAGSLLFFIAEGVFFQVWAGDFLFALHAHEQSQSGLPEMTGSSGATALGLGSLIWERLTLLMHPSISGWGYLGAMFWPAIICGCWLGAAARCMALWAAGTFLLIAFAPVHFTGGYQPYPHFHGRHILPACIPFALCLAVMSSCIAAWLSKNSRRFLSIGLRPAFAAIVLALGLAGLNDLRGFCDRQTSRVGETIGLFVLAASLDVERPIFMTPSTYWRYRILFPEQLGSRLRVAAAADAPAWWKDVTPDIQLRAAPLPKPGDAYLLATSLQLAGAAEWWDYGVTLPEDCLQPWRDHEPTLVAIRGKNRNIHICPASAEFTDPVAVLIGPVASPGPVGTLARSMTSGAADAQP